MTTTDTLAAYVAWRRTKCPVHGQFYMGPPSERDHALLEAVGEAGELLELVADAMDTPEGIPDRDRLIDEAGDVLFTATWLAESLTGTPPDLIFARRFAAYDEAARAAGWKPSSWSRDLRLRLAADIMTAIAKFANVVKKALYHGKPYAGFDAATAVEGVLYLLALLLLSANSSLREAADRNVAKLDARYPAGFVAGGGAT